ncbi:MAG: hypothetical protein P8170_15945 [Gemmatimonadota bacterium]
MPSLNALPGLSVEEIPNGSNVLRLRVDGPDPVRFRAGLEASGILILATFAHEVKRPLDSAPTRWRSAAGSDPTPEQTEFRVSQLAPDVEE